MRYKIGLWAKSQAEGRVCNRVLFKLSPQLHGYHLNLDPTYIPSYFVKGQSFEILHQGRSGSSRSSESDEIGRTRYALVSGVWI
jgi:hypothetical protein